MHVDDGVTQDIIPFFVKADPKIAEAPPVALMVSTFTYMGKPFKPLPSTNYVPIHTADANEHLYDETREAHFAAENVKQDKYFDTLKEGPDLGISLYGGHSDGSGTWYSSSKRPILNMRLIDHSGHMEALEGFPPTFGISASLSANLAHKAMI